MVEIIIKTSAKGSRIENFSNTSRKIKTPSKALDRKVN
jgi:hypothetical protein